MHAYMNKDIHNCFLFLLRRSYTNLSACSCSFTNIYIQQPRSQLTEKKRVGRLSKCITIFFSYQNLCECGYLWMFSEWKLEIEKNIYNEH